MVPPFPFLVSLHELQSRVGGMRIFYTAVLAFLAIVYANNSNKTPALLQENRAAAAAAEPAARPRNLALTTLRTADYEVNLYWAIPFTPRGHGEGLVQPDSGAQFVLLDLSVKNTSANRVVDVGELLLSAKIIGTDGREYASDPLVIAAFTSNILIPTIKHNTGRSRGCCSQAKPVAPWCWDLKHR